MDNVVNFPKIYRDIGPNVNGVPVKEPRNGREYLDICKQFLEEEDYRDILCGIMDKEYYNGLEEALRKIVNCYYAFEM